VLTHCYALLRRDLDRADRALQAFDANKVRACRERPTQGCRLQRPARVARRTVPPLTLSLPLLSL